MSRPVSPCAERDGVSTEALDALRGVVGNDDVLVDPEMVGSYEVDWTGRFRGSTAAVVRPGSVEEVARVVEVCRREGVRIVPQGGNTGLVGGSVPRSGEIVLSLTRLGRLDPVDRVAGCVTAGAGVTLGALQRHARASGYEVGIDFAARDSATLGGIVATNAGGERVLGYGMTRHQIRGVEAVLPDGSVVRRLGGLVKDNCGYDLSGLLVGSEGTLGIVTAACVSLFPRYRHRTAALIGLDSTADAIAALARFREQLEGLQAADLFYDHGLELVCRHASLRPPFDVGYDTYMLVEVAGQTDVEDRVLESLSSASEVRDATVASDETSRGLLWRYRERHTEAISAQGVPIKLDVALPLRSLAGFVAMVGTIVETRCPHARAVVFGHLGEGNLHVNILGADDHEGRAVSEEILALVGDLDGSIAAEHGVGVAKASSLRLSRSPAEIAAMLTIKQSLDPQGLFNPGALLDGAAGGRPGDRRAR